MRDGILTNRSFLGQRCNICYKYTHFDYQCPKVRLYVNRDIQLAHHLRAQQKKNERSRHKRKVLKKERLHALRDHASSRQALIDCRQQLLIQYTPFHSEATKHVLIEHSKDYANDDLEFYLKAPGFKFSEARARYMPLDAEEELEAFEDEEELALFENEYNAWRRQLN